MKKLIWVLVIAILVWNVILSGELYNLTQNINEITSEEETAAPTAITGFTTEVTDVAKEASTSIVMVYATREEVERYATGVIYASLDGDIYIFTTADNVTDAEMIIIRFDSGAEVEGSFLISDSATGLALLKCTPDFQTSAIKLGDSFAVSQGEYIIAVGGRRRETENAEISFGVTSSAGMRTLNNEMAPISVLETDVVVNNYNVGGPLLNINGEMVGLLVSRPIGVSTDIGISVSVNELKQIYAQYIEEGTVHRGVLGAIVRSVSKLESYQKSEHGIRLDTTDGVIITNVLTGSPAEGILERGDILTSLDNETIADSDDLMKKLYSHRPDETVTLTYKREGTTYTVNVVLK